MAPFHLGSGEVLVVRISGEEGTVVLCRARLEQLPYEGTAQLWTPLTSLWPYSHASGSLGSCQVSSPFALPPEHAPHPIAFI